MAPSPAPAIRPMRPKPYRFKAKAAHPRPHQARTGESGIWLYGLHAVRAALANRKRAVKRCVLTARAAEAIGKTLLGRVRNEIASAEDIGRLLPQGAVHQGVALLCEGLPRRDLLDTLNDAAGQRRLVVVLDQIADPQNVGAVLRAAAAFGAAAVVVQDRHAPAESGTLAKAASGALDVVPYIEVVNIARALEQLGEGGFWRIALTGNGDAPIADALATGDLALVLGSESSGIRKLVRERCDTSAFIPIDAQMESLNVSNAAAVALYEARRTSA